MKFITKDMDYAIRAVMAIASSKKKSLNVKEILAQTNIPRPFLRKIMQTLSHKGIVNTIKGRNGGFSLVNEDVSFHDIITAFAAKITLNDHIFRGKKCQMFQTCNVRKEMDDVERELNDRFKNISIKKIVNKK